MCKNYVEVSGKVEAVPKPNHFIINSDDDIIHCHCNCDAPNVGDEVELKGTLKSKMYRLYGKNVVLIEVEESFRNASYSTP